MAITLTERAAGEIKRVREEQKLDEELFLRIGVAGGGCSGFNYTLGFDNNYDAKKDSKYNFHGVDVVVDKRSSLYLDGTKVDWFEGDGRRGFTFENPNAVSACSCCSASRA